MPTENSLLPNLNPIKNEWVLQVMADGRLPAAALKFFTDYQDSLSYLSQDAFASFLEKLDNDQEKEAIEALIESADFSTLASMMGDVAKAQEHRNQIRALRERVALAFISAVGGTAIKVLLTILRGGVP